MTVGAKPTIGRPPSCTCGVCRKCKRRKYMKEWYRRKTPEERREWIGKRDKSLVRERDRERYRKHKAKRTAQVNARDPLKAKATKMVNIRVAKGTMKKAEACEDCGSTTRKLTGHHEDYEKPLDVTWLCYECHGKRHRKEDHELVTV